MEIDTGRHWVGLSEVYIRLGECWLPSVDSVHSVHCNYCIPDTIVRINCEHFRLTTFVGGYNNKHTVIQIVLLFYNIYT